MSYSAPFHRIVMIGDLFTDKFNVTLSVGSQGGVDPGAVSQTLADNVGAAVAAWWPRLLTATPKGIGISAAAKLTSVKVNRIGTDGRYMDPETREWVAPTPVAGSASSNVAPQLTIVSTLRGPAPRARAGIGRMYFPPSEFCQGVFGTDGRIPSANAALYAQGTAQLLLSINAVYLTAGISAVAGIASKVGTGAFQPVDVVTVGRVVDTMRSRRNKLVEDPAEFDIT